MDQLSWRIVRSVYSVLASVAVLGITLNTLLLLTSIKEKSLRSTTNTLIGLCAFFDVIHQMGYLVQFPILFSDYFIDSFICTAVMFLPELGLVSGALCVFSIGIDRMLSITIAVTYKRLPKLYFLKVCVPSCL
ncbi:hypothetical protein PENTCL1PPCAC_30666 [Pristionchus entomophagus]|uniref:G-protein coupled receptors family 1 profile domain-containing protein n=1 Tax=Pristionchus entomophagus TaxID=358040 RepID=A0AAV5SY33_9BILA|nr:hypothetical protein PENTCL1PPCAC_7180 [Pristionchus entomophagus]GMT08493.1 hypothetical protein PENTCL1PPCAC_30666 [Pristionchus entomophagus]